MSGGLANGTRLFITKLMSKVIQAKITTAMQRPICLHTKNQYDPIQCRTNAIYFKEKTISHPPSICYDYQ